MIQATAFWKHLYLLPNGRYADFFCTTARSTEV